MQITQLSCGGSHILLLNQQGYVYSYGTNKYGQLGHSLDVSSLEEPKLIEGVKDIVFMACGDNHSLLIAKNGQVYSFGNGKQGQLGM